MSSLFLENFGEYADYFGNRRNLLCEFVVNDARVMPGRRSLGGLSPHRSSRCRNGPKGAI